MPSPVSSQLPAATPVPAPLASAINSSAKKYKVPADLLAGIWRVESASTYPNPAVNSSGYGGLFGTRNWNASTQAQADQAASILARQLVAHGGDIQAALSAYSGGGYTTVPGETTFGQWNFGIGKPSGFFGSILTAPAQVFQGITGHNVGASPTGPGSVLHTATGAATGIFGPLIDFVKGSAIRVAEVVGGAILILVGLFILTRGRLPAPGVG